jgi:RNA polymerase sigma-70 factor, ECF subfamily
MAAPTDDAQESSAAALDLLFQRCWEIAWPTAFSLIGNKHAAEDAAQEALTRIFRALPSFDRRLPLEPWVRRIAVNAALNELRRERRQPLPLEWMSEVRSEASTSPEEPAISQTLLAAVAALPVEKRAVVVLHYWLDWPLAEIAEVLEVPVGTVASHLSRARAQLRSQLEEAHV